MTRRWREPPKSFARCRLARQYVIQLYLGANSSQCSRSSGSTNRDCLLLPPCGTANRNRHRNSRAVHTSWSTGNGDSCGRGERAGCNSRSRRPYGRGALSEKNSKYLERPSNRSDRPGKMQENQWPRNPVLTFWQSNRIYSDNASRCHHPLLMSEVRTRRYRHGNSNLDPCW